METSGQDGLVGTTVDGRYRVLSLLARGGMATVYEALDLRLDRVVALKIMHPHLAHDQAFVSRFQREARAAARLTHGHVVAVYDQGDDNGIVYLAMEYVPGRTLRDVLRQYGPLTPEQALVFLDPVLEALVAAHAAGFVHRDIKPENVLISDDGRVKVADFGLARAVEADGHSVTQGMIIGTVAYLSPEQVERGEADGRSDVYAAGILLFEMITGQVPHAGESPLSVAYQHVNSDVPPPSSIVRAIPPEVDALVVTATRRDATLRYQTAFDFLADTRRIRASLPPPRPFIELQLVSFSVAEQEYAMSISDVQEIVQIPEQIIHVPHSDSHVLGVMTLRQRMLPLVSLRRMFGLPLRDGDEQSRILVISVGNASVGVVMDSVNEVLRVSKNDVSAMPSMLARDGDLSEITEICRLNNGKRLVSIISAEIMFHHHAVQEALSSIEMTQDEDLENSKRAMIEDDEQMVVFRLGSEEFGVPIESVQEIVRVPEELTHVPKAPAFVEGVINLRGAVLPVVDQRRRLGLPTLERCEQQRIMVFLFDGVRTGFIVDSVAEVLKIARSAIEPAPHLSEGQSHLISRVANLEKQKRIILLIEPLNLLDSKDRKGLSSLVK